MLDTHSKCLILLIDMPPAKLNYWAKLPVFKFDGDFAHQSSIVWYFFFFESHLLI